MGEARHWRIITPVRGIFVLNMEKFGIKENLSEADMWWCEIYMKRLSVDL